MLRNLYINPISTFNPNSSKGDGNKITHIARKNLTISSRCYVVSFRVIASIMGNLDIKPISTFNPISTKGEGKRNRKFFYKSLKISP